MVGYPAVVIGGGPEPGEFQSGPDAQTSMRVQLVAPAGEKSHDVSATEALDNYDVVGTL